MIKEKRGWMERKISKLEGKKTPQQLAIININLKKT